MVINGLNVDAEHRRDTDEYTVPDSFDGGAQRAALEELRAAGSPAPTT